jgi:hypothetical protein
MPRERDTITTEEVMELGGWDKTQGTMQPREVVEIKTGMGFSKKVRFKRG